MCIGSCILDVPQCILCNCEFTVNHLRYKYHITDLWSCQKIGSRKPVRGNQLNKKVIIN